MPEEITALLSGANIALIIRIVVVLAIGLIAARLLATLLYRITRQAMGNHSASILRRVVFYAVLALTAIIVMRELGFSLGVLLGAAGIFSVAIGIASQTSASNLVSGIFLVAERAFELGDIIRTGDVTGEVLSIDLLSVKLRTFDNLYVRVPNESLIKSNIVNLTRFPIRRFDMQIGIAYKEDIGIATDVLVDVADSYPLCLHNPRPLVIFQGFGDSAQNLQFSIWAARENFLELRNTLPERIARRFKEQGIEIPFPHRTLYAGSDTGAFPVHLAGKAEGHPEQNRDVQVD